MITLASKDAGTRVTVTLWLWRRLILELRRRGQSRKESGAFLLAPQDSDANRVTSFVCYDDLDPDAYEGGAIAFHAVGHAALWEFCRKRGLRVLADVHTHPGSYIRHTRESLSALAAAHELSIRYLGRIADYGYPKRLSLRTNPVYEFTHTPAGPTNR